MKDLLTLDAHLKAWREISIHLKARRLPSVEVQKVLQQSMQSAIEAQNTLQKLLEPIFTEQERWEKFTESTQIPYLEISELSQLAMQSTDFQRSIQQLITPAFEQLRKTFRELPEHIQDALLKLAGQGWYWIEVSSPSFWKLRDALAWGNIVEAEEALIEHFENQLVQIEQSIIERFPHREHLIKAAFKAHQRQEYELSIPVLLAQTDGICEEVAKQNLFMSRKGKPCIATYVEQIAVNSYQSALLSPLSQTLPISESKSKRTQGAKTLNRHAVLHGESLNYGSKINSLKAISLIHYVAHVLEKQEATP